MGAAIEVTLSGSDITGELTGVPSTGSQAANPSSITGITVSFVEIFNLHPLAKASSTFSFAPLGGLSQYRRSGWRAGVTK